MSTEVSLRASRSSAEPMPCRRASTRRSKQQPDRADQQAGDGGGGAHPGDQRARPRGHAVERCVRGERALLALGGECRAAGLEPRRRTWRRRRGLLAGAVRARLEHRRALRRQIRERASQACARSRRPMRASSAAISRRAPWRRPARRARWHRRRNRGRAEATSWRCCSSEHLEVVREPDGLQRVLTDQCDRILGLAGELDDGRRQHVHDGEREGDGAVELGCDLRARQPQPVEHGVPARRS